tara:strand:+ start:277 stop:1113 length:837 start_codon:yes stop_codon:yes gene_type:complete
MKYLSLIIILFSINSFAITCTDDEIDLNPGDVISADMVKDVFQRISNITKGFAPDELNGVWQCKTDHYVTDSQVNLLANGYSKSSDGLGRSMTQDITFTKQDDDTFLMTFQNSLINSTSSDSDPFTCRAKLLEGSKLYLDSRTGINVSRLQGSCYVTGGIFPIKKISKSCFYMKSSLDEKASTTCQKKSLVPLAPTDLTATLSGSSVSLSWTSGDSSTVSYTLKAKTSNTGTYSDVITENNGTTFTDTLSSGTKWYRVYGINSAGTSIGSNVVSVTAP